jgi:hypothetical protein
MSSELLSAAQVAEMANLSRAGVLYQASKGYLKGKKEDKQFVFKREDVDAWLKDRGIPSVKGKKPKASANVEDAIIYLRQAQAIVQKRTAEGKQKKRDPAHVLAELALMTLQGDI